MGCAAAQLLRRVKWGLILRPSAILRPSEVGTCSAFSPYTTPSFPLCLSLQVLSFFFPWTPLGLITTGLLASSPPTTLYAYLDISNTLHILILTSLFSTIFLIYYPPPL